VGQFKNQIQKPKNHPSATLTTFIVKSSSAFRPSHSAIHYAKPATAGFFVSGGRRTRHLCIIKKKQVEQFNLLFI
jgi:hypothetical protein